MFDVQVLDNSASPTLSRLLTPGLTRNGSLKKEGDSGTGNDLCQEMADLMHDFGVLSRITELISTLKGSYKVGVSFYNSVAFHGTPGVAVLFKQ